MFEQIKKYIFEYFEETGIYISNEEKEKDIDLRDYLVDSLEHVTFIIEMEEKLGYELPDEILLYDNLSSINGFINMLIEIKKDDKNKNSEVRNSIINM